MSIIHEEIKTLFEMDGDDKLDSVQIISGNGENKGHFRIFKLHFDNKYIPDGNEGLLKDKDGKLIKEIILYKNELNQVLVTGGMTNCIRELSEFNAKNPVLNLEQAFHLSKQILTLAVTIKEYTEAIPAIGGELYFAAITPKGFAWLNSTSNSLNLLE